jgi:hypothetical protein
MNSYGFSNVSVECSVIWIDNFNNKHSLYVQRVFGVFSISPKSSEAHS